MAGEVARVYAAGTARTFPFKLSATGSVCGFAGLEKLQEEHAAGLEAFRKWAKAGAWDQFHRNHYDWWMFPLAERSSRDTKYTVSPADAARIAASPAFVADLREGVRLLLLSWGWDLEASAPVPSPGPAQRWTGYSVRLYKAGASMQVLYQDDVFEGISRFAQHVKSRGDNLRFSSTTHARGDTLALWAAHVRYPQDASS